MTTSDAKSLPTLDLNRFTSAETALYRWSPLGFWGTTLAVFVISFGSFAMIAEITGRPHLGYVDAAGTWQLNTVSWVGFVLSMILTTGVALTQIGRRRWETERASLLAAIEPLGHEAANALCDGAPVSWRRYYWALTAAGVIVGLVFNLLMLRSQSVTLLQYLQSIGLWFLLLSPWLYAVGMRAGLSLAREGREMRKLISEHVVIDLYHLERLDIFGRIGLAAAGSWLVMAGVLLLFVADASQAWIATPAIALAVLGGVVALTNAVRPIQRKIHAAKAVELAQVHKLMAQARERAFAGDDSAASALAGLTDYEVWVERRPEWPISTSVTLRFSLYILIPILPILGSYLFEKFADGLIYGGVF
ncbi:hypothetical protein [uncultured Maricaulis sp.]|uniref:hypothetical protein n=1 Tax=uncultured Maricaulis sp. TaxID=174710 RepID=UPI0030D89779|tara:strand:- start:81887 stop:82972 length:1086 start_codon:yes stop_codon:yes gene_type:complete